MSTWLKKQYIALLKADGKWKHMVFPRRFRTSVATVIYLGIRRFTAGI